MLNSPPKKGQRTPLRSSAPLVSLLSRYPQLLLAFSSTANPIAHIVLVDVPRHSKSGASPYTYCDTYTSTTPNRCILLTRQRTTPYRSTATRLGRQVSSLSFLAHPLHRARQLRDTLPWPVRSARCSTEPSAPCAHLPIRDDHLTVTAQNTTPTPTKCVHWTSFQIRSALEVAC